MLSYLASSFLPVSLAPQNPVPSIHTHHCTSTLSHPNSSVISCATPERFLHLLQPCCWLSCISHRPLHLGGCRRGGLQSRKLLQALGLGKKWNESECPHCIPCLLPPLLHLRSLCAFDTTRVRRHGSSEVSAYDFCTGKTYRTIILGCAENGQHPTRAYL